MRFILLAAMLIGFGWYLSHPQVFGRKGIFQPANNGRVVIHKLGTTDIDIDGLSAAGADLFGKITESIFDTNSPSSEDSAEPLTEQASAAPEAASNSVEESAQTQMLSAIQQADLSTYNGRLNAIYSAINNNQNETTAAMSEAIAACLSPESSSVLVNYFVQMLQVTAITAQQPEAAQASYFEVNSAPLTDLIKAWLISLPAEEGAKATKELQNWAARPVELVACNLVWLDQGK